MIQTNTSYNLRKNNVIIFLVCQVFFTFCLENKFVTPSLTLPPREGGVGGGHFHCSCLHAEGCFACLRVAASAKAGHAGVGDAPS